MEETVAVVAVAVGQPVTCGCAHTVHRFSVHLANDGTDDAVPMRRPFWKKRAGRCAAARAAADEFDGSTHRLTSAVWPPPMSNERRTAEFGDSTRDA